MRIQWKKWFKLKVSLFVEFWTPIKLDPIPTFSIGLDEKKTHLTRLILNLIFKKPSLYVCSYYYSFVSTQASFYVFSCSVIADGEYRRRRRIIFTWALHRRKKRRHLLTPLVVWKAPFFLFLLWPCVVFFRAHQDKSWLLRARSSKETHSRHTFVGNSSASPFSPMC